MTEPEDSEMNILRAQARYSVILFSSGLLSKWGFNDGDIPDQICDALELAHDEPWPTSWRAVLVDLVRRHVLPKLDQQVEVVEIVTNHNPIRATVVDGIDVRACWTDSDHPQPHLTPEQIEVPWHQVIAAIRRNNPPAPPAPKES